jgi:hypothetical protein
MDSFLQLQRTTFLPSIRLFFYYARTIPVLQEENEVEATIILPQMIPEILQFITSLMQLKSNGVV